MTKDTMLTVNLKDLLKHTPTALQCAHRSIVILEGVLEDVIVSIDSWEYPSYFIVLEMNEKINGYPLIVGNHGY
jgi:hypothetical protein